jgi:hypothetical protein
MLVLGMIFSEDRYPLFRIMLWKPAGNKKAARSGGCSDFCCNSLQIERDPPAASELS